MIQWEEVELMDATHVEINGEVFELGIGDDSKSKYQVVKYNRYYIEVYTGSTGWQRIRAFAFPILGIKCLRKKKPTPIEFEATFAKCDGGWHPMYCSDDGFAYQNNKKAKFRCVQIMEDKE
jgi:hypothetical protein